MSLPMKFMAFIPIGVSIAAAPCATAESPASSPVCVANTKCVVTGRLDISRGMPVSGASIEGAGAACMPAVLPEEILRDHARWNNRTVVATGVALLRAQEHPEVIWAQYRDRKLPSGM